MSQFNIRVYGLIIQNGQILLSHERYKGKTIVKFPGGGLEYGEGTLQALRREIMEELGMEWKDWTHFYTTDFFQKSAFDLSQVISIYYLYSGQIEDKRYPSDTGEACFHLLEESLTGILSMPIDKMVMKMLLEAL